MVKFLENSDEVLDFLQALSEEKLLKDFKIGVAGSYARAENKKNSAIDIVLKLKDNGDKSLIGSFAIIAYIHRYMENVYSNKVCIYWLDLLEKDEVKLLDYMKNNGYEANPESVYTNLIEDVKWVYDEDSDEPEVDENSDEDSEEDEDSKEDSEDGNDEEVE